MNYILCWSWIKDSQPTEQRWKLELFYEVDEEGEPTHDDCPDWHEWYYENRENGVAITTWSIGGIELHTFRPPGETVWIKPRFFDDLKKMRNWDEYIAGGDQLYGGTYCKIQNLLEE